MSGGDLGVGKNSRCKKRHEGLVLSSKKRKALRMGRRGSVLGKAFSVNRDKAFMVWAVSCGWKGQFYVNGNQEVVQISGGFGNSRRKCEGGETG